MKSSSGVRAGGNWVFVVCFFVLPIVLLFVLFLVGFAALFFVLPLVVSRDEK